MEDDTKPMVKFPDFLSGEMQFVSPWHLEEEFASQYRKVLYTSQTDEECQAGMDLINEAHRRYVDKFTLAEAE